jgi:hypothetical protein
MPLFVVTARRLPLAAILLTLAACGGDRPASEAARADSAPAAGGQAAAPSGPAASLLIDSAGGGAAPGAPAPGPQAQSGQPAQGPSEADMRALTEHKLTLPEVEKAVEAQRRLNQLRRSEPATVAAFEQESQKADARTLDASVALLERHPKLRQAIGAAGLAPREFLLTIAVLTRSMMLAQAQEAGQVQEIPAGPIAENVRFVRDNQAELQRLAAVLQADAGEAAPGGPGAAAAPGAGTPR